METANIINLIVIVMTDEQKEEEEKTNGRTLATVLRLSVDIIVVVCNYVLWLNGVYYSKTYH